MSVTVKDELHLYGESTDLKPTTGMKAGAEFLENDTHILYYYNGSAWKRKSVGRVQAMPYGYDIAEGNIPEHYTWTKMGVYSACGTTDIDLWEGGSVYTWLTAAQTVSIISSSAGDNSSGSGVQTIYINYLTSAGVTGRETVTMTGTAAVTSTNTMYRINSVSVASVGGGMSASGNITIAKTAGGTTLAVIMARLTKTGAAIYQVPAGKTVYITSITVGVHSATKGVRFILRSTYDHENKAAATFFLPDYEITMANGSLCRALEMPIKYPADTRIKVSAIADAAGAYCTCALRGWIESA